MEWWVEYIPLCVVETVSLAVVHDGGVVLLVMAAACCLCLTCG